MRLERVAGEGLVARREVAHVEMPRMVREYTLPPLERMCRPRPQPSTPPPGMLREPMTTSAPASMARRKSGTYFGSCERSVSISNTTS
jgi:hypothetical protein